jgi:hypothetical protein
MAYWYIRFKSRDGNIYEARIYGKTGNTNVQLQGAESPFTTEEKDTDSMFESVITQSGYLQIEDNGYDLAGNAFDWHDLVPQNSSSRMVELLKISTSGNNLMWAGFIQPRTFDGEYLAAGQTRKFPLICVLSQLEGIEVDPHYDTISNFAGLLFYLLGDRAEDFYFQGVDAIDTWLLLNINWSIFADIEEVMDAQGGIGVELKPKMNKLEALEETCKFFGWTCRVVGRTAYFASPDSDIASAGWQVLNNQDLENLANGGTYQPGDENWQTYAMSGNPFGSDDNDEYYVPGIKRATITADVGEQDGLPEFTDEKAKAFLERIDTDPTINHYSNLYEFYYRVIGNYSLENSIWHFFQYTDPSDNTKLIGSYYEQYDYWQGSDLTKKHNYNWQSRFGIYFQRNSGNTNYNVFSVESRFPKGFSTDGVLAISGTVYHELLRTSDGQTSTERWRAAGNLWVKLIVGKFYYDGRSWQEISGSVPAFAIPVGTEDDNYEQSGKIIDTRTLSEDTESYEGYGARFQNISLGGIITLHIVGYDCGEEYVLSPSYSHLQHSLLIENLKFTFAPKRSTNYQTDDEKNSYTAENNVTFNDETEENVMFASNDNNSMGTAIIMNDNLAYVSKLPYTESGGAGYVEHPEQQLADRMAAFGSKPRKMIQMELETKDIPAITPAYKITAYDNNTYYPLVLKRDWKEGQTTIKMIEL